MSDLITLEAFDADGAIQETAEAAGATRADFLKRGGVAGAGFLAGGVLFNGLISPAEAAISTHKRSKKNDVKIANYALTLEYLEAEFYKQAVASGAITQPEVRAFATTVAAHEATHVKTLKGILGSKAVKKPKFDFGDTVTNQDKFKMTSQVLEDTGVAAYAGQGPNLLQRPLVVAALLDPLGRGAPRGVDPVHQLERRPPRHGYVVAAGTEGVRQGAEREEGPERRQEDGLHPG